MRLWRKRTAWRAFPSFRWITTQRRSSTSAARTPPLPTPFIPTVLYVLVQGPASLEVWRRAAPLLQQFLPAESTYRLFPFLHWCDRANNRRWQFFARKFLRGSVTKVWRY